jgi:uncharacterized C2H2 Zn-finger protein
MKTKNHTEKVDPETPNRSSRVKGSGITKQKTLDSFFAIGDSKKGKQKVVEDPEEKPADSSMDVDTPVTNEEETKSAQEINSENLSGDVTPSTHETPKRKHKQPKDEDYNEDDDYNPDDDDSGSKKKKSKGKSPLKTLKSPPKAGLLRPVVQAKYMFNCPVKECKRQYKHFPELKRHSKVYHHHCFFKEKDITNVYKCPSCSEFYEEESELENHLTDAHSILKPKSIIEQYITSAFELAINDTVCSGKDCMIDEDKFIVSIHSIHLKTQSGEFENDFEKELYQFLDKKFEFGLLDVGYDEESKSVVCPWNCSSTFTTLMGYKYHTNKNFHHFKQLFSDEEQPIYEKLRTLYESNAVSWKFLIVTEIIYKFVTEIDQVYQCCLDMSFNADNRSSKGAKPARMLNANASTPGRAQQSKIPYNNTPGKYNPMYFAPIPIFSLFPSTPFFESEE